MSLVGTFPGMMDHKRRIIRAPVNPLDKSTIVSIYPRVIDEFKCTIQPGRFTLPPGSLKNPSLLVVGPSSWWREVSEEEPLLEIPVSSIQIADSVIKDYANGLLAFQTGASGPGLFYVPGEYTVDEIRNQFPHELEAADMRQKSWYGALIKLGDALWARSNGNPLAISDDMRMAAKEMGHETRDWMRSFRQSDMVRCIACGNLRNPEFPICQSCKYIDTNHPAAKDLKFAG